MVTLTIRNLPEGVRDRLRLRAAENGRSMEAEARHVLAEVLAAEASASDIREAQRIVRQNSRPGGSIVDELIAERRQSAKRGE